MTSRGIENESYLNNYRVKAFLDLISRAEGTYGHSDGGYDVLCGYGIFTGYFNHPNIYVSSCNSTAAGRYQFLKKTWDSVKRSNGLPDFTPHSQDIGAVELIRGEGALNDIINGNVESAIKKVNNIWASFPGSPYGQGTRSMSQMLSWYESDTGDYASGLIAPIPRSTSTSTGNVTAAGLTPLGWLLIFGIAGGLIIYNSK